MCAIYGSIHSGIILSNSMADQRGVAGAQMHRAWHSCSMLCLLWVHHMVAATSSAGSKDNVMVKAADSIVWSDHAFVPELAERTQDVETENETVYVSIVAAGRNDQYGGRFVERVQLFIDSVVAFACAAFAGYFVHLLTCALCRRPAHTAKHHPDFQRAYHTCRGR